LDQVEIIPKVFRDHFFYLGIKSQINQSLLRFYDKGSKLLSRFCYVFPHEIHSGLLLIKDTINNSMVKYRHLILRIDDILNELHGSCMFSKIDLKIVYHQIKIKEGDEGKNNFKTKYRLFK